MDDRAQALAAEVSSAAHDLTNAVGVIGNYAELLNRSVTDPVALSDIRQIDAAAREALGIVRRLALSASQVVGEPADGR